MLLPFELLEKELLLSLEKNSFKEFFKENFFNSFFTYSKNIGLFIYDFNLRTKKTKEGKELEFKIEIGKYPQGDFSVSLDDCVQLHRYLLDVQADTKEDFAITDFLCSPNISFEVSSPGVERILRLPSHWAFLHSTQKVKMIFNLEAGNNKMDIGSSKTKGLVMQRCSLQENSYGEKILIGEIFKEETKSSQNKKVKKNSVVKSINDNNDIKESNVKIAFSQIKKAKLHIDF